MDIDAKLRPLYLTQILKERTDEDHYLTTPQLCAILKDEYGMETHRTTIKSDIEMLQQAGIGIQAVRSSQNQYNFIDREFDIAELKLLIDAVESSKFITKSKSEQLVAKREVPGAVEVLINTLKHYGIHFDEGATIDGDSGAYGPYRQRQRAAIYHVYAKQLVLQGDAYPCFCTEEELTAMRAEQEAKKVNFGYYGEYAVWRDRPIEDVEAAIAAGKPWVLRFRSTGSIENKFKYSDLVKGTLTVTENDIDQVLLKSDGIPTYHFAHAVDDHLMRTTHVVRGDEWLPSLPFHLQLFRALGFRIPKYVHIGPLMKMDGTSKRKLSKRKDPELALTYYKAEGFPVRAVYEYVMTLLNSNYEDLRKANPTASSDDFKFSCKKLNPAGALFDYAKLCDVSKNEIARLDAAGVYDLALEYAKEFDPELMAMFKEIADIKTADMLDLPVPTAVFHNISVKPSEIQKQMVAELAERAERVRNGMVDAKEDNMLKITNDGRKLALDQRLINPLLPDFEDSKLNACVDAMFETWERGSEKRLTQLFFCDLSTPKNDGSFNVYDDIRQKLIARGVPADEIKFIHEADTEAKKLELFKKVRRGDVRILMGSTQKMGAGTNVQNKLAASSDLDCPWRPSDLEQRLGRSIRQGNENAEVHIYRFVTEETFDAYLYQLVEGKQKFASQIMTSKSPVRSCEDIDETALSYAEIKMLATGNPHIKEKMDLDIQVQKLRLLKSSFLSEKYALEDKIIKFYPQEIARRSDVIAGLKSDMERVAEHPKPSDETFVGMTVKGAFYSEKADAGNAILEACKAMTNPEPIPLGEYRGFTMELYFEAREYKVRLKGELGYPVTLGTDTFGNITRLDNALEGLPKRLEMNEMELDNLKKQFETAKVDVERPFPQEEELKAKTDRLNELNALLNVDKRENEIVGGEPDEGEELPEKKQRDLER